MSDLVEISPPEQRRRWQDLASPSNSTPPPPEPPPSPVPPAIAELYESTLRAVGRVRTPRDLSVPHTLIAKALAKDEWRRQEQAKSQWSWHKPVLDTPFEQRRLRILQALFLALEQQHCKPSMSPKDARSCSARVGDVGIGFSLDWPGAHVDDRHWELKPPPPDAKAMRLKIDIEVDYPFRTVWEDAKGDKLESHLGEFVASIITSAEIALEQFRVEREEWARRDAEREREAAAQAARQAERDRIRQLYRDARNWRRAEAIRAYVAAVEASHGSEAEQLREWKSWALKEAHRADPIEHQRDGEWA